MVTLRIGASYSVQDKFTAASARASARARIDGPVAGRVSEMTGLWAYKNQKDLEYGLRPIIAYRGERLISDHHMSSSESTRSPNEGSFWLQ